MKKSIGYIRVSGREQTKGQSLDEQRRKIEKHCTTNGIDLVDVISDAGVTGSRNIQVRPGIREILDRAGAGEFDTVIVLRLDRFSRNLYEALWCEKKLLEHGVAVVSIEQDTSGLPAEMATAFRQIMLTFAELDKNMTIKKMGAGKAAKFKSNPVGPSAGRISYGYATTGPRGARELVPEPQEQAGLKKMREMQRGGFGAGRIAKALNGQIVFRGQDMTHPARVEGEQWSEAMVRRALSSNHSQGRIVYAGRTRKLRKP